MYRCILVPVDGTAFGEHALPHAATLARHSGATLHLAHVHQMPMAPTGIETVAYRGEWSEVVKREEDGYLAGLAERLARLYAVAVQTRVIDGPVAPALEAYALECGAGLVVMSTHGHTGVSRIWHHGVADQVSRELPLPVLLVRPEREDADAALGAQPAFRRILVPLDGTPAAEEVLEHAAALGAPHRARLTLLRVVQPRSSLADRLAGDELDVHHQLVRGQTAARQYLSSVAERLRAAGLEVETQVRVGADAGAEIVAAVEEAARHEPFDLVAMERRAHHLVSRMVATHTSDAVRRRSRVPLLLLQQLPRAADRRREALAPARQG